MNTLSLNDNQNITDEGLKYIPNITVLFLCRNEKITDQGLKHIPKIKQLHLNSNENITNAGLAYIPNVERYFLKIYPKFITKVVTELDSLIYPIIAI